MNSFRRPSAAIFAGLIVSSAIAWPATAAVVVNQVDDFEDSTLRNWSAGATNPTPPTNITTGGPDGANDNYMRLSSNAAASAGGKLVAFNTAGQWAGNYITAGVDAIEMQVNNQGATALTLRLIFVGGGGQSVTTVADVIVPAGSGWTTASFPVTPPNLSGASFSDVMSNVTELNLVHSPTVIPARSSSPNITAQLGVDDVTAVAIPEPGAAIALVAAAGAVALAGSRPKRRRRRRVGS